MPHDASPGARAAPPDAIGGDGAELRDILRSVAAGSRHDLKRLYARTGSHLLAVLIRMLGSRAVAEELLVDTFVSIWRDAHTYNPDHGSARAWVFSVGRQKAVKRLRACNRDHTDFWVAEDTALALPVDYGIGIPADGWLSKLTAEQLMAVRLSFLYAFTHQELAAYLSVTTTTAELWVTQAIDTLQRSMVECATVNAKNNQNRTLL